MSHPVWVRGLKPTSQFGAVSSVRRTLCGCLNIYILEPNYTLMTIFQANKVHPKS